MTVISFFVHAHPLRVAVVPISELREAAFGRRSLFDRLRQCFPLKRQLEGFDCANSNVEILRSILVNNVLPLRAIFVNCVRHHRLVTMDRVIGQPTGACGCCTWLCSVPFKPVHSVQRIFVPITWMMAISFLCIYMRALPATGSGVIFGLVHTLFIRLQCLCVRVEALEQHVGTDRNACDTDRKSVV